MDDDEIWELARKPVTEFVEAIKNMDLNIDRLVKFYLEHTNTQSSEQKTKHTIETDGKDEKPIERQILSPLACAKLELAIVFAINACYWVYLVSHGEDPTKKEISKNLARVRLFMNRAKEIEDSLADSSSSSKRPRIDKEASKRLCMNNISMKSNWT